MNWRRLYATVQIWAVVGGTAIGGAICWDFVIVSFLRLIFHLEESKFTLLIGFPIFFILSIVFVRILPKHLRKAGVLSDDPSEFGSWFVKHSDDDADVSV